MKKSKYLINAELIQNEITEVEAWLKDNRLPPGVERMLRRGIQESYKKIEFWVGEHDQLMEAKRELDAFFQGDE